MFEMITRIPELPQLMASPRRSRDDHRTLAVAFLAGGVLLLCLSTFIQYITMALACAAIAYGTHHALVARSRRQRAT